MVVVNHVVDKVTRTRKPIDQRSKPNQQLSVKRRKPNNQTQLNNFISGRGIGTIPTSSNAINKYIMSDILTITEGLTFDESLQKY